MLNRRKNKAHIGYKILAVLQIFMLLSMMGCSSAGVSNGSIRGEVFSNRSGGSLSKTPEPGVSVVAVMDGGAQEIIRNAQSDGNGHYVFSSLPVGKYTLGFLKDGFEPITTEKGTSRTQTAIGESIRVFVETGATTTAPAVTLTEKAPEGDGTVIINLVDSITGERVNGANMTLGTGSTNNSSNGQYVLTVVVKPEGETSAGEQLTLTVNADGYENKTEIVQALAGQTIPRTVLITPTLGRIEGQISLSRFEQLYNLSEAQITVDGIGGEAPVLPNDNGFFSVEVPVRTTTNQRSYTLRISLKGFLDQVVNNILGPVAGSVRVDVPPLIPETVTIIGTVANPATQFPAVVSGTGLEGGITGGAPNIGGTVGTYSIDGVPTNTREQLTVSVTAYQFDEAGTFPPDEIPLKSDPFTATNNGTGVYRVDTIAAGGGN